jgi:hypothetical protein
VLNRFSQLTQQADQAPSAFGTCQPQRISTKEGERQMTTRNKTFSVLILCIFAAIIPSHAQGIRVVADNVQNENSNGTEDHLYFQTGGSSSFQDNIKIRIDPGYTDHWDMYHLRRLNNVTLYEGFLGNNQKAVLFIAARAKCIPDWSNLGCSGNVVDTITNAIKTAVLAVSAFLFDPSLALPALSSLQATVQSFASSLNGDGDTTIGAFTLALTNSSGVLSSLAAGSNASVAQNGNVFVMTMTGAGHTYPLTLHVEPFHGARIQNQNSGLCVDVPDARVDDQVPVQQFTCNGGLNQSWLPLHTNGRLDGAQVSIVSENSGKCLDIPGFSMADHAIIQQYTCNFGWNQQWVDQWNQYYFGTLYNPTNRKCLDVPDASRAVGVKLQQYTCHSGPNQQWANQ